MPRGGPVYTDPRQTKQSPIRNVKQPPIRNTPDVKEAQTTDRTTKSTYPGTVGPDLGTKIMGMDTSGPSPSDLPVTIPKVEVPVINPPKISEAQKASGVMAGVSDVTPSTVAGEEAVKTAQAGTAKPVTPTTAQTTTVEEPEDVKAATYVASQVDPMAAQAEAVTTDYKAKVEAAQGTTPEEALVSNQMEELTKGLESGDVPMWAQGAVDSVDAQLASRGLSRSSIGRGDLNRAILAAALPIAQGNAATVQQTFLQNLQNQQRANEIKAQLDTQVELQNLTNQQQTALANQASKQAIMLSNQSADNAAKQFNATSQNQVNTFMANLKAQTAQFNAAQANAMSQFNAQQVQQADIATAKMEQESQQFNVAQTNAMAQFNKQVSVGLKKFNADQAVKADMFNKQNQMAVNQANTQWRRQLVTQETQMQHDANMQNAQNRFNLSMAEQNNRWQVARDLAGWAWQSEENNKSRQTQLIINSQNNEAAKEAAKQQADAAREDSWADSIGAITGALIGGYFNSKDKD